MICAICKKPCSSPSNGTYFYAYEGDSALTRKETMACWTCTGAAEETIGRGGASYNSHLRPNVYDVLREMLKLTQGAKP